MENWKNKISLVTSDDFAAKEQMKNTFRLFFCFEAPTAKVLFIPLNEKFKSTSKIYTKALLLSFQRELIEEDDVEFALDVLNLFNLSYNNELTLTVTQQKELKHILDFFVIEYSKEHGSYLIIKSVLKIIMLSLIRIKEKEFLPKDINQNRVYQFLNLMEQNFQHETDTNFYAKKIKISDKRLNQILKEKLRFTAKQLIVQRQLTEIKRELLKKDKTVKQIAFTYNFNSVSAFSRFFKRYEGISPIQFTSKD
ncbi:AraC-type DNA-binding protein [Mesonia phycicola]|uniref:AraC-type DNA-binding protein n=1 Tax=Mesonia phycicola TaxID=579105 RepID=A0A1M6EUG9_9FLAO|nr:helix-turn-helix domain-containing protein [Mesonia phycicola]SHI89141.1 AraC-type DNA-binding protein [Mesonia phycicola]